MVAEPMLRPTTVRDAALAKKQGAIPYAGGTDLMVRRSKAIRTGQCPPILFLDGVEALHGMARENHALRIGGLSTMAAIAAAAEVPPLLARACQAVGSPSLRNVATIGGNICTASPAGDSLPALYALDADVELVSPTSRRRLPIDRFISGPGRTALAPDELLTAVVIPVPAPDASYHRKVSPRATNAITKVSLAVALTIEDRTITDMRIAYGSVGPTVIRCTRLEAACTGRRIDEIVRDADRLVDMARVSVKPIDDLRSTALYRRTIAANLFAAFLDTITPEKP